MGIIKVLDRQVADLIAAGEVVERPASVIKELMENSIDAGATQITVEIREGGISFMRVSDNGIGLSREDAPLAFIRHATSKISSADDLEGISTLGFRGEALAALCAVSKVTMLTKCEQESVATAVRFEGGELIYLDDDARPQGTTITITDLFYNTPARMKFLKKNNTEAAAIASVVDKIALANPDIAIKFIKDYTEQLCTDGDGNLLSVINKVFGRDCAALMLPVDYSYNGIKINGFVSKPNNYKSSRNYENFYINSRYVRSKTFMAALEEGVRSLIPSDKYPICVLDAKVDFRIVDVNVHPQKLEVKFSNEKLFYEALYYSVKNALQSGESKIEMKMPVTPSMVVQRAIENQPYETVQQNFSQASYETYRTNYVPSIVNDDLDFDIKEQEKDSPAFKIAGELYNTYIIVEMDEEIIFIDKHAAAERLLYEKLKSNKSYAEVQHLLAPITINLTKEECSVIVNNTEFLNKIGFEIEEFGEGAVIVRAIPMDIENQNINVLISSIAASLLLGKKDTIEQIYDKVLHSVACRASVKAGQKSSNMDLYELVAKLLENEDIRTCPHGRPAAIFLTKKQFEKQFLR